MHIDAGKYGVDIELCFNFFRGVCVCVHMTALPKEVCVCVYMTVVPKEVCVSHHV